MADSFQLPSVCTHGFKSPAWCKKCKELAAAIAKEKSEAARMAAEALSNNSASVTGPGEKSGIILDLRTIGKIGNFNPALTNAPQLSGATIREGTEQGAGSSIKYIFVDIDVQGRYISLKMPVNDETYQASIKKGLGRVGEPFLIAYTKASSWDMQCPLCNRSTPRGRETGKVLSEKYPNGKWVCSKCIIVGFCLAAAGQIGVVRISQGQVTAAISSAYEDQAVADVVHSAVADHSVITPTPDLVERVRKLRKGLK